MRLVRLLSMVCLAGCAGAPPETSGSSPHDVELPADVLPPPGVMTLTSTPFVIGDPFDVTVTGALPGETLLLVRSTSGPGAGPCPAAMGGTCFDVLGPLTKMGNQVADATGAATWSGTVPATLAPGTFWMQVADPDPVDGNTSNALEVQISLYADADADGHDSSVDCDDGDPAIFPGADERCNGLDDDCDGSIETDAGAFATLQDAVDAASAGDTICIPAGTYTEDLVFGEDTSGGYSYYATPKEFRVLGAGPDQTVIEGTVTLEVIAPGTELAHLTVRNSPADAVTVNVDWYWNPSSVDDALTDVVVEDCGGDGIVLTTGQLNDGDMVLSDVTVSGCAGSGLFAANIGVQVTGGRFASNGAHGVAWDPIDWWYDDYPTLSLVDTEIVDNGEWGLISLGSRWYDLVLERSRVLGNRGGGVQAPDALTQDDGNLTLLDSDIVGNRRCGEPVALDIGYALDEVHDSIVHGNLSLGVAVDTWCDDPSHDPYGTCSGCGTDYVIEGNWPLDAPTCWAGAPALAPAYVLFSPALPPEAWDLHLAPSSAAMAYGSLRPDLDPDYYVDADGDGLYDAWELVHGLDPAIDDAALDPDGDTLTNADELDGGTLPTVADSDGDGANDADELLAGTDPHDPADTDWSQLGTDPALDPEVCPP